MRRLLTAVPLALALAPAAQAAQLQTGRACYLQDKSAPSIGVTGNGFPAARPYTVSLDGSQLDGGAGVTDDAGAMNGSFNPPLLGDAESERRFQVGVASDDQTATSTFTVTRFLVDFAPTTGDPAKWQVRFSLFGFGLDPGHPQPRVYMHWIAPNGRLTANGYLGRAQGDCGTLKTKKRRLFPFKLARTKKPVVWTLQFDTRKNYNKGTAKSGFLWYKIRVKVI